MNFIKIAPNGTKADVAQVDELMGPNYEPSQTQGLRNEVKGSGMSLMIRGGG